MIVINRKKAKRELKALKKYLRSYYEKNDQELYITSLEDWKGDECFLSIVVTDKKGEKINNWLFEIMNLKAFETLEVKHNFYMRDTSFYRCFDVVTASTVPFYFDRTFTLKKFTPITEKDIINCCKYFVKKVLKEFCIWNIEFIKPCKNYYSVYQK